VPKVPTPHKTPNSGKVEKKKRRTYIENGQQVVLEEWYDAERTCMSRERGEVRGGGEESTEDGERERFGIRSTLKEEGSPGPPTMTRKKN